MQLIENASKWYKMWSVQALGLIGALEVASQNWEQYTSFIPDPYHSYVQGGLAILGIVARLVKQSGVSGAKR